MNDYNDFYQQSIAAGAQPDEFGGVLHTSASIVTMQMQKKLEEDFFSTPKVRGEDEVIRTIRLGPSEGGWLWRLFNGR